MDLFERQQSLEQESVEYGIKEYYRKANSTPISEQTVGLKLMRETLEPFINGIKSFRFIINSNPTISKVRTMLNELEMTEDQIAYITLKVVFNASKETTQVATVSTKISEHLLDHYEYEQFKKHQPKYLKALEQDLASSGVRHRHTVIMLKKRNKFLIADKEVSSEHKFLLGKVLLEILINVSGLFELEHYTTPRASDSRHYLRPTHLLNSWLKHQHEVCEVMSPFYMPMIYPPKPWTTPFDGGYYSDAVTLRNKIVKTRNKDTVNLLKRTTMPEVYSAITSVQNTAWRVNQKVLGVLKEVWESGACLGDLPSPDDLPLPPKPWNSDAEHDLLKESNPEIVQNWKWAAAEVHDSNHKLKSKRIAMAQRIRMADKFKEEVAIYYPHTLDFRGRMYPIPTCGGMHPQGDDSGKALLEFAEGKKLTTEGLFWLMVHGANTYGYDKDTFEGRVQWVKDNHSAILDSAENPLDGGRFWSKTKESPYCFLAFCIEYAEYQKDPNFISHIPVAMDGSCNGLQNFSALLLDEVGGKAVNLKPCDKPADIYSVVAQKVSDEVIKDTFAGDEMAKLWVGKVDRKMAKRSVMTLPYGAKKYGFKDQLMSELKDRPKNYLDTDDHYKPAIYLAGKLFDGIGEVVIAARAAMDWLQEVSKVVNKTSQAIIWTTPMGLPAYQMYVEQKLHRIETYWGELRIRIDLGIKKDTDKLDKRKQSNGIAPNFVHSLDASHLQATVNLLSTEGINQMAMIHDSYGCLASDIPTLNRCLREAFITQYSTDLLSKFREEIINQLPEELHMDIPELPTKGTLDLNEVRNSRYFFA